MKIVILAGGSGTRLWPVSRDSFPKQFLTLEGDLSLLQRTIKRFWPSFPIQDILIITNVEYYYLVKEQVGILDREFENRIVVEPERKNTGPALALALKKFDPSEVVLVSPADHLIAPEKLFLDQLPLAEKWAKQGSIVTFGIRPSNPETGYGYLEVEGSDVVQFTEKPSLEKAKEYLARKNFLWNSGMFVFTVETFWNEVEQYAPALLSQDFADMPVISIDYAIMEKSKKIKMILLDLIWSDIGSWDTVYEVLGKDENHNVKIGNVYATDTKNCLIYGGKRLIAVSGIEELCVVEAEDALLVIKKGDSQSVKQIVEELKRQGKKESSEHKTIYRPWGKYTILEEGPRYKVKRIVVEPMQRLSLQWHHYRSEHWVVVKGKAKVTIGEKVEIIGENQSVYVPKEGVHRLENPTEEPLELIEVQVGDYVGEDDIVRVDDVYGRS